MIFVSQPIQCLIFLLIHSKIEAVSYNRPKFSSSTIWNHYGITFATNTTVGKEPYGIFIDVNDNVYVANRETCSVQIWSHGNVIPTRTLVGNLTYPRSLFVTTNGDIYVDNGNIGEINKWSSTGIARGIITIFTGICFGLFVDISNNLYCSVGFYHQIERTSLNRSNQAISVIAGRERSGQSSTYLDEPRGIFVDTNLTLYVADSDNGRIQRFWRGQTSGITVAGNGASGSFVLETPHGIILDADGYLFITDSGNDRIICSGPSGFRCLFGCNGRGSTADRLDFPQTLAFDSYGNIFVSDRDNSRIQKFLVITHSSTVDTINLSITNIPEDITTIETTESITQPTLPSFTNGSTENYFIPPACANSTRIGLICNISNMPCDILKPCENNGICINTNLTMIGYECICSSYSSGINCEIDYHLCTPNPCWNDGQCYASNTTFNCTCPFGWEGNYCETKVNYCSNVKCLNRGVCRALFRNFTCECLGDNYSGLYCEITATRIIVFQILSKSFASVAILIIVSFIIFIIMMDILKYFFGIDVVRHNWRDIRRLRHLKMKRIFFIKPTIRIIPSSPLVSITSEASEIQQTST